MGFFGPSKGSIGETIDEKIKAGRPYGRGSASAVQARQARARKKQIKKAAKQRKQDAADVRRAKLIKGPPRAADGKKFKAKAIKKGNKRRTKKAARKAERKARGFWG